jgi:hypothetical protein
LAWWLRDRKDFARLAYNTMCSKSWSKSSKNSIAENLTKKHLIQHITGYGILGCDFFLFSKKEIPTGSIREIIEKLLHRKQYFSMV